MIQVSRLKRLFRDMTDIYSPSGKEKDIVDFLHRYLKKKGFPVIRQEVQEDRDNLVIIPPSSDASLVFIGHIDTVTAHDLDSYSYREARENPDIVYGLGVADMKGGCAAMIEALVSIFEEKKNLPSALALVVGEEENGEGMRALLGEHDFDTAVVGEPTDLQPCFSHFGYIEAKIVTSGSKLHASMAAPGKTAVETMLQVLLKIVNYFKERKNGIVYNIRDLASSESGFAVPQHCEVRLDLHVPVDVSLGAITDEIEELVEREQRESAPDIGITFEVYWRNPGYRLPEKGPLFDGLKTIYKKMKLPFTPGAFRSHSDANLLWEVGIKPVILGPGQLEKAHMEEESISFFQVEQAARIYESLLKNF